MPRARILQNNFTAGEFTPRLHARQDFDKYKNALHTFHNWIAFPHGAATRRPGTRFVKAAKDSSTLVRLIPFEFNVLQTYMLEFGEFYIRFFTLSGRLEDPPGTPVEVVTPYADVELFGIQYAQSADVLYLVHPNHPPMKLSRTSATVFNLTPIVFKDGPYLDENPEHTISLHVDQTEGPINVRAVGQELFIPAHVGTVWRINLGYGWGSVRMAGFISSTHMTAVVEETLGQFFQIPANVTNQPLRDTAGTDILAQGVRFDRDIVVGHVELFLQSFAAPAGEIWLEIRQADLATGLPLEEAIDVSTRINITAIPSTLSWVEFEFDHSASSPILNRGQQYYFALRASQGYSLTNFVAWRFSPGDIYENGKGFLQDFNTKAWFDTGGDFALRILSTDDFRAPAWTASGGWPSAVAFFEQRLYLGRGNTVYGSVINDFETFSPSYGSDPPSDENAVTFTIASTQINAIQWIAGADELFIGTAGAEYRVVGSNDSGITPNNLPIVREVSSYGSAATQPIKVGKNIVYLRRSRTKISEVVFNLSEDSFTSVDLMLLSEHIGRAQFSQLCYQQDPDPGIFGVLESGEIARAVYLRSQDVVGWSRLSTPGRYESVAAIHHPGGDATQVWVVVKRGSLRCIEYFEDRDAEYGQLQLDSALSYSGPPTSTLSGLDHLEGQIVHIVGDKAVYAPRMVSGGAISGLDPPVSSADVGLMYVSTLKELRPPLGEATGTVFGLPISAPHTTITLLDSLGLTVGGDIMPFRKAADPINEPPPIYSGDKDVHTLGWDRDAGITVEQTQPLPCTILAITRTIETGEP